MNENKNASGLGFTGALTLIFIVLKLIGEINWPWIWVLSPLWIVFGLVMLLAVVIGVYEYVQNRN